MSSFSASQLGLIGSGAATVGLGGVLGFNNPYTAIPALALIAQSYPRVSGEVMSALGTGRRLTRPVAHTFLKTSPYISQSGRLQQMEEGNKEELRDRLRQLERGL